MISWLTFHSVHYFPLMIAKHDFSCTLLDRLKFPNFIQHHSRISCLYRWTVKASLDSSSHNQMSVTQSNTLHNLLIILITYCNICISYFNIQGANLNTIGTFRFWKDFSDSVRNVTLQFPRISFILFGCSSFQEN